MASNHKPTALKLLQGNAGKRPLPKNEPMPEPLTADAKPPEELEGIPEAVKAWNDILPRMVGMKVMTVADVPMLVMYCEAAADERNALEQMNIEGAVQETATGYKQVSAWFTVRKDALARRMKILSLFGMTPSDRVKVQTVGESKKGNKFS